MIERDEYEVEVTCPVCGDTFECSSREANGESTPCCTTECEEQWPKIAEDESKRRLADLNYRCGYESAAGYPD